MVGCRKIAVSGRRWAVGAGLGTRIPLALTAHRRPPTVLPCPAPRPAHNFRAMSTLLHVALAQFKPRKGNYAANLERLREILAAVNGLEPRPRVLVLPETALTGYFVEGGVRDLAVDAGRLARDIARVHREAVGNAAGNGGPVPPLDVA